MVAFLPPVFALYMRSLAALTAASSWSALLIVDKGRNLAAGKQIEQAYQSNQ
jgi:hypothetical protein